MKLNNAPSDGIVLLLKVAKQTANLHDWKDVLSGSENRYRIVINRRCTLSDSTERVSASSRTPRAEEQLNLTSAGVACTLMERCFTLDFAVNAFDAVESSLWTRWRERLVGYFQSVLYGGLRQVRQQLRTPLAPTAVELRGCRPARNSHTAGTSKTGARRRPCRENLSGRRRLMGVRSNCRLLTGSANWSVVAPRSVSYCLGDVQGGGGIRISTNQIGRGLGRDA